MDILGLKQVAATLPTELQTFATALIESISQLETKTAGDVEAIADKVIAGIQPMVKEAVDAVNTVTLTINASVVEITGLARRIDGAEMKFTLGSEVPDNPTPAMTVQG